MREEIKDIELKIRNAVSTIEYYKKHLAEAELELKAYKCYRDKL